MEIILIISTALVFSLIANVYLYRRAKAPQTKVNYHAKQLIKDFARGGALVEFRRIDPDDIYLRSPRELN